MLFIRSTWESAKECTVGFYRSVSSNRQLAVLARCTWVSSRGNVFFTVTVNISVPDSEGPVDDPQELRTRPDLNKTATLLPLRQAVHEVSLLAHCFPFPDRKCRFLHLRIRRLILSSEIPPWIEHSVEGRSENCVNLELKRSLTASATSPIIS